jgi:hypothetical protein
VGTTNDPGAELSQLARFLFDSAAARWYTALSVELLAAVVSVVASLVGPTGNPATIAAALLVLALFAAYGLRLHSESQYDLAETMRRQSVLTEGLGWPLDGFQVSEWKRRAGRKLLDRLTVSPRPTDYYTTAQPPGANRFAQMMLESAFYTRNLYLKFTNWLWVAVVATAVLAFKALAVFATTGLADSLREQLSKVVFGLLPLFITANAFGWILRLGRITQSIADVERGLERSLNSSPVDLPDVLRQVSEYNCQVAQGIPILTWMFKRWHDDIERLWQDRLRSIASGGLQASP